MSQTLSQKKILWSKDHIKPHARVPRMDSWSEFGLRVLALVTFGVMAGLLLIAGELLWSHLKDYLSWVLA